MSLNILHFNIRFIYMHISFFLFFKDPCSVTCCSPHPEDCGESMEEHAHSDWLTLKDTCHNKTSCSFENPSGSLESCDEPYLSDYMIVYYNCFPGIFRGCIQPIKPRGSNDITHHTLTGRTSFLVFLMLYTEPSLIDVKIVLH